MRSEQEVDQIVRENAGLVASLVSRTLRLYPRLPSGYDRDDLHGIGNFGLLRAAHTFDAARGAAFSTYAYKCIENAIIGALKRAHDRQIETVSLDQTLGPEGDDNALRDLIVDTTADATRKAVTNCEREILEKALAEMPEQQVHVIRALYFEESSIPQVAAQWRLSPQAVQVLHVKALKALKLRLRRLGVLRPEF